jgi:hypothetical protein
MKENNLVGIKEKTMNEDQHKYNLPVITAEVYNLEPSRYELKKGNIEGAPPCPFGHQFKWIGFDKKSKEYVRVTKSVFKKMIQLKDKEEVESHENHFKKYKEEL